MERLISLLSLKPIILGFVAMLISGATFPLAGVIIVRDSLIPMRYMLMHGVILGGIFSIAFGLPLIPVVVLINILLVLIMVFTKKDKFGGNGFSTISTLMMVCTMGIASLLSKVFDIPAKETLDLFWGSPFTLTNTDLIILISLSVILVAYICAFFKEISMLFFDKDIAISMGVNVRFHNTLMLLITALIISVSMKMIGALLIDALVILPVVTAGKTARGLKDLFIRSSVTGFVLSFTGYILSLVFNLPLSGVLAILSAILLFTINFISFLRKKS